MTALSIPVALTIALHCAPAEDPRMLVGIARQESGLETMTLHDDTSGEVLRGAGVIDAARRLIVAGHSVDLGAWQINSRNLALLGLGVADVFEPCKAVAGAARLIELFSRYNTGSPSRGIANGYARAVLTAIRAVKAAGPAQQVRADTAYSQPPAVANPFTKPSRTGRDLVFTTEGR
jgi:type IV secretion system protein VirB1